MKQIPCKDILLFKSCLVSVEYPGIESSTRYLFDQLGIEYLVDERQSCCTGLGHYYDLFDQFSTTALAARNLAIARETGHKNMAVMCATCYAILKKACQTLEENKEIRDKINNIFEGSGMGQFSYQRGDFDSRSNIFHVAEILYNQKDKISNLSRIDLSSFKMASHHACHYCKAHYADTLGDVRDPQVIDTIIRSCGAQSLEWYDHQRLTCGAGFRQRFTNKDLSLSVTAEKLLSLKEKDVEVLVHMCPNCQMQFDRYQPTIEKILDTEFDIVHLNISQLVALASGADPYRVVGVQTHTVPVEPFLKKLDIDVDLRQKNLERSLVDEERSLVDEERSLVDDGRD